MRISRRKILLFAGSGVLGGAAAAAAGAVTFVAVGEARYANRFYPGVRVDGEDVGGLTLAQARDRLQAALGRLRCSARRLPAGWSDMESQGPRGRYSGQLRHAAGAGLCLGASRRMGGTPPPAAPDPGSAARLADHGQFRSARVHGLCRGALPPRSRRRPRTPRCGSKARGGQRLARVYPSREGRELVPADVLAVMSRRLDSPQRLIIDLQSRPIAPQVATGRRGTRGRTRAPADGRAYRTDCAGPSAGRLRAKTWPRTCASSGRPRTRTSAWT